MECAVRGCANELRPRGQRGWSRDVALDWIDGEGESSPISGNASISSSSDEKLGFATPSSLDCDMAEQAVVVQA